MAPDELNLLVNSPLFGTDIAPIEVASGRFRLCKSSYFQLKGKSGFYTSLYWLIALIPDEDFLVTY